MIKIHQHFSVITQQFFIIFENSLKLNKIDENFFQNFPKFFKFPKTQFLLRTYLSSKIFHHLSYTIFSSYSNEYKYSFIYNLFKIYFQYNGVDRNDGNHFRRSIYSRGKDKMSFGQNVSMKSSRKLQQLNKGAVLKRCVIHIFFTIRLCFFSKPCSRV